MKKWAPFSDDDAESICLKKKKKKRQNLATKLVVA